MPSRTHRVVSEPTAVRTIPTTLATTPDPSATSTVVRVPASR